MENWKPSDIELQTYVVDVVVVVVEVVVVVVVVVFYELGVDGSSDDVDVAKVFTCQRL